MDTEQFKWYEQVIKSKAVWLIGFCLCAFISSSMEIVAPSRIMGMVSAFGLLACFDRWQKDPKGWAMVFFIGLILGIEFGGLRIFS